MLLFLFLVQKRLLGFQLPVLPPSQRPSPSPRAWVTNIFFPYQHLALLGFLCSLLCAFHDRGSSYKFPLSPFYISPNSVSQSSHSPCIRDLHAFCFPSQAADWQVLRRVDSSLSASNAPADASQELTCPCCCHAALLIDFLVVTHQDSKVPFNKAAPQPHRP